MHMLFPCSEARVITRKSIAGSLRKLCVVIPTTGGRCTDTSLHIQRKFYAPFDAESEIINYCRTDEISAKTGTHLLYVV